MVMRNGGGTTVDKWADESNYSQIATITLQFGKQTVHLHVEMHA